MNERNLKFSNWTLVIDQDSANDNYLTYLKQLSIFLKPDKLTILSTVNESEVPSELLAEIPNLNAPTLKEIELEAEMIGSNYFNHISEIDTKLIQGDMLTEILSHCKHSETDLLIVKNTSDHELSSRLKKLIRKAPCCVMSIPKQVKSTVDSVLVPTDFSIHSDIALDLANKLLIVNNQAQLTVLHAYHDSSKYVNQVFETVYEADKYIRQKSTLDHKLRKHAEHKLDEHLKNFSVPPQTQTTVVEISKGHNTGDVLNKSISDIKPDLLLLGAKGISKSKISLTGAVSEEVYTSSLSQPTIIIKEKKENINFLNALLNRK